MDQPTITANGFHAVVEAYAADEPPEHAEPGAALPPGRLWLLSLLGSRQAVRAIWATLISPQGTAIITEGARRGTYRLATAGGGWRWEAAALPATGGYHGLLLPASALRVDAGLHFLLVVRLSSADGAPEHDPAAVLFAQLTSRCRTPLHPAWAGWLWATVQATGMARPVPGGGVACWEISIDQAALEALLSAAIRDGQTPPISA